MNTEGLCEGEWKLCERTGWADNQSFLSLIAWCWRKGEERFLVVLNFSEKRAQGRVQVPWGELSGRPWPLTDVLSGENFDRGGDEMIDPGLYVDLEGWTWHFLKLLCL